MRGSHCIRHWSSTQPTIAPSSGQAELGGISKGMSQGIGLRSIAQDLGVDFSLQVRTDATAAIGMSRRLGVGNIRHLDVTLLWVQDHVRSGDVALEKVPGIENPADCLTKYVSGPELRGHLARMNLEAREGRAESAPQLTTSVTQSLKDSSLVIRKEHASVAVQLYPREGDSPSFQGTARDSQLSSHRLCGGCGSLQSVVARQCGVCDGRLGPVPTSECSPCPVQLPENLPLSGESKVST